MDRQNIVWDILDKELTSAERKGIAVMITVTPEEEIAHAAAGM
jgi:hypothetical protein